MSEPASAPLLEVAPGGLECRAGGFYVDPWEPVPLALVTHAHLDRLVAGCGRILTAEPGVPLVRLALGPDDASQRAVASPVTQIEGVPYGERRTLGAVTVSFHPSGHVLGGAQVRIEHEGEVWVVAGDWKRARDPTCAPFELVPADVLLTEANYALPIFRWPAPEAVVESILAWWEQNAEQKRSSLVYASSPGTAEQLLALVAERRDRPVLIHPSLEPVLACYRAAGVKLPETNVASAGKRRAVAGELAIAPPSARGTPWARAFSKGETALAAGSVRVRGVKKRRGFDRGFVLSEHADWPALLETIVATGARRVLGTHGRSHVLVRALREKGIAADALETRFRGEDDGS
jgi:putative mRNA 3-end processing factor